MKKAKLLTLLVVFTTLTILPAMAGVDWKALDVGNISCAIWNTAVVGFPQDVTRNPSGWWPAGTNDSYIFEGGIWIGAKKGGEVGVSASDSRGSELWPTNDVPEVISTKTGATTTKGTPTSQSIYFQCTDENTEVNDNPLGLKIEVNGYQWSYAPLYDFFILEYKVKNVGEDTLTDIYMAFRYDIDVSSNETGTANYPWDDFVALDDTPDGKNPDAHPHRYISYGFSAASAPGYVGLRVLAAYVGADSTASIPFCAHRRITIDTDASTDAGMYALMSTQTVDLLPANPDEQRFVQSYGPIPSLASEEEFNIIIAVGIGEGLEGLQTVMDVAQELYDVDYQAPAPPPSPKLFLYPGDGKVTLHWDGTDGWKDTEGNTKDVEEYVDPRDEKKSFMGYRIYRKGVSFDSETGEPVEDWKLLADVSMQTGLTNFFTDTGLTNGIRYVYAVTSYDTGNPETGVASMESSKTDTAAHVFPRSNPAGYKQPALLAHTSGEGSVSIEPMVVDWSKLTENRYKVIWHSADDVGAWAFITGPGHQPPRYDVVDAAGRKLIENQPFEWYRPGAAVEALSFAFDGIVLKFTGVDVTYGAPTENKIGKVDLTEGTVTDWAYNLGPGSRFEPNTGPELWWATYYRPHTYTFTFTDDTHVKVMDETTGEEVPFNAERADGYAIHWDVAPPEPDWRDEYSPDVSKEEVEGKTVHYFRIFICGAYVYIIDPNRDISKGDQFTVEMLGVEAPRDGDEYLLDTKSLFIANENAETDLDKIRVVPNPYFVTNRAVESEGTDKIFFTHLPAKCTIRIYTLAGELVREIEHNGSASPAPDDRFVRGSAGGAEAFDLLTYNQQALASGIYIYHIDAGDIGQKIGKFAIIRGR